MRIKGYILIICLLGLLSFSIPHHTGNIGIGQLDTTPYNKQLNSYGYLLHRVIVDSGLVILNDTSFGTDQARNGALGVVGNNLYLYSDSLGYWQQLGNANSVQIITKNAYGDSILLSGGGGQVLDRDTQQLSLIVGDSTVNDTLKLNRSTSVVLNYLYRTAFADSLAAHAVQLGYDSTTGKLWLIPGDTVTLKTAPVLSVNGLLGNVELTTDSVPEGSINLYFTNQRVRNAISGSQSIYFNNSTGSISAKISDTTGNGLTLKADGLFASSTSAVTSVNGQVGSVILTLSETGRTISLVPSGGSVTVPHDSVYTSGANVGITGSNSVPLDTLLTFSTIRGLNDSISKNRVMDTVATITQLEQYNKRDSVNTLVVTDSLRGGLFTYSSTGTPDSGTVFSADGRGTGYWIRNYGKGTANVTWFGAKPDSSSDCTTAIQMAIKSLDRNYGHEGGIVYFPGGNYKISSPITMGDRVSLMGSGWGTTLFLANSANCNMFQSPTSGSCAYFFIKDIQFIGNNGNNTSGTAFAFLNNGNGQMSDIYFLHLLIAHFKTDGIYIEKGWQYHLEGSTLEIMGQHDLEMRATDNTSNGSIRRIFLVNNQLYTPTSSEALVFNGNVYTRQFDGIVMTGNFIINSGPATAHDCMHISGVQDVTLTGNRLVFIQKNSTDNSTGIKIDSSSFNAVVSGNTVSSSFEGETQYPVHYVMQFLDTVHDMTITSNNYYAMDTLYKLASTAYNIHFDTIDNNAFIQNQFNSVQIASAWFDSLRLEGAVNFVDATNINFGVNDGLQSAIHLGSNGGSGGAYISWVPKSTQDNWLNITGKNGDSLNVLNVITHFMAVRNAGTYPPSPAVPYGQIADFRGRVSVWPAINDTDAVNLGQMQDSISAHTGGGGSGTVTNFTSGNLTNFATTSVSNGTTTPALSFSLTNSPSHSFFGNNTGSSAAPNYYRPDTSDILNYFLKVRGEINGINGFTWNSTTGIGQVDSAKYVTHQALIDTIQNAALTVLAPLVFNSTDGTIGADTSSSGLLTQYGYIDSMENAALTVLSPLVFDSMAKTIGADTTTGNTHLATQAFVLANNGGGGGSGTVTSVGLTTPSWLTVSGSPVTTSGTLAVSATGSLTTHEVLGTGTTGAVSLMALTSADIPVIDTSKISNFGLKSRSLLSAGTGISYNPTTGVITNSGSGGTDSTLLVASPLVKSTSGTTISLSMDSTKYTTPTASADSISNHSLLLAHDATLNMVKSGDTITISADTTKMVTPYYGDSHYAYAGGSNATGTWSISTLGNAGTATKLATARNINGIAFDGSANISVNLNNALTNGFGIQPFTYNGSTPISPIVDTTRNTKIPTYYWVDSLVKSSYIAVPTLEQVTTAGNTTDQSAFIGGNNAPTTGDGVWIGSSTRAFVEGRSGTGNMPLVLSGGRYRNNASLIFETLDSTGVSVSNGATGTKVANIDSTGVATFNDVIVPSNSVTPHLSSGSQALLLESSGQAYLEGIIGSNNHFTPVNLLGGAYSSATSYQKLTLDSSGINFFHITNKIARIDTFGSISSSFPVTASAFFQNDTTVSADVGMATTYGTWFVNVTSSNVNLYLPDISICTVKNPIDGRKTTVVFHVFVVGSGHDVIVHPNADDTGTKINNATSLDFDSGARIIEADGPTGNWWSN